MLLLSLVFMTLFSALGLWQLQRAEIKRDIENRYLEQLQQPYQYVVLDKVANEELVYRKVRLHGEYDLDHVLLVDNQLYRGKAGYHVLVPFFIDSGRRAVLVNRGWVAAGYDRRVLPSIQVPRQPGELMGIVTVPSLQGYRLGEVVLSDGWPQRIPYIDLTKIQQGLSFEILPYVIWQAPEMDDVYVREWKPIWSPPEKSEAYAVQWFSFAFIVVVLFIVLNLKKTGDEALNE